MAHRPRFSVPYRPILFTHIHESIDKANIKYKNKIHYIGEAETLFDLRTNNHRKDTRKPESILANKHFQQQGHNFNKHKFIIIVNLDFWIQKLKTLTSSGLNQELSK